MFGLSPLVAALVATIAALVASTWWFGVHRRQLAERSAGIAALAGIKWRECVGLVLQALAEKGYREAPASRQPGDGGTEFLLVKGDERCLLSYKHGTAYRLGEANVRDFANAVQLQGATSGILVTLGTAEGFARDLARRYGVELIDGRSLWPQVEPFAPPTMVAGIREHAAGLIRRGQQIGVLASVGLGVVVFLAASLLQSAMDDGAAVEPAVAARGAVSAPATASDASTDTAMEQADAAIRGDDAATAGPPAPATTEIDDPATRAAHDALRELEEVAQLSDAERLARRQAAAASIAGIAQVESAIWSTQSTLTIRMNHTDGIDDALVEDACARLADYEEIRYSRLQLEAPATGDTTAPVRWRVCQ